MTDTTLTANPTDVAQFQTDVGVSLAQSVGVESAASLTLRTARFVEEAIRLAQANGMSRERVRRVLYSVYGDAPGIPSEEVGAVIVNLTALSNAMGVDMVQAGVQEHARIQSEAVLTAASTPAQAQAAFDEVRAAEREAANAPFPE